MGKNLDHEFQTADIAMGSLGMHRIGLSSGSVLKLREYTARGLPSVIGYNDSMISKDEPFLLQIPADESPLNIDQLIIFYQGMKAPSALIRRFAEDHFSWQIVLKPVFERI